MDPTFSLASVLPTTTAAATAWTWVAETLAVSDRADTSLLHDIISSVPSLLSESSRAVRDRIALKYLEEWLDPRWPGPPLPCGDAGATDLERSAEDVLLHLLDKASTSNVVEKKGTELFKHELRQFVLKKRLSLPKCSIDQLLDKKRGFSQVDSSKKKSGFSGAEAANHNGFEYCSHQNNENGEKRTSGFTDDKLRKLKKTSSDQSYDANKAILQEFPSGSGQRSPQQNGDVIQLRKQMPAVSSADNWQENLQEDLRGYGQQLSQETREQNDVNLELAKHVSSVVAVKNGCSIFQQDNSGRGQLSVSEGDNAQRDTNLTCDEAILQEGPCILQKGQHNSKELQSSKDILAGDTYKQISCEDDSGSGKQPSDVAYDELSISMAANHQKKTIGEKTIGEKNQNPYIPVLQDTEGDMMGKGLCFRCDKGGLLLNCSSSNCSVAVHESCVGLSITLDQTGCFICPVCSYTRAALSYSRAKKRYFQAKKAFENFVGTDLEQQSQEELSPPEILRKKGQAILDENLH